MARLRKGTISRRTVAALKTDRDTTFWDRDLPGFGVRVHPSGRKVYVVQARARGEAATRVTLGVHGVLTPEEARRRAALVVARVKAGEDPVVGHFEILCAGQRTLRHPATWGVVHDGTTCDRPLHLLANTKGRMSWKEFPSRTGRGRVCATNGSMSVIHLEKHSMSSHLRLSLCWTTWREGHPLPTLEFSPPQTTTITWPPSMRT